MTNSLEINEKLKVSTKRSYKKKEKYSNYKTKSIVEIRKKFAGWSHH